MEASGTKFLLSYYVYGHHECKNGHDVRSHLKFYGNRASGRDYYLGKYVVTGRKGSDDRFLVDHTDSGIVSGGDGTLSDKYRKCLQTAGKSQGK